MSQIKHLFHQGDSLEVLRKLPDQSVHCCVTSPPYWNLRDYGVDGQIGLEKTPEEYVTKMVNVFREVNRVLRDDGTLWLNLGDSYNNTSGFSRASPEYFRDGRIGGSADKRAIKHSTIKTKDLVGIPWLVAFALRADGWYLRSDIIWAKPNPMPESVTDRPTKAHEYLFLLAKSGRYYYDAEAIKEPASWDRWGDQTERKTHPGTAGHLGGKKFSELPIKTTKNKRTVWTIATQPYPDAHFATFPQALVEPCILAGCPEGGTVLDPFGGSGTVSVVAKKLGRGSIYIDLNPEYLKMALKRMGNQGTLFEQHRIEVIK